MSTLHFKDSELEIHKVVVGPMDNNVFVIRCKQTGEGLLIDAANEHELLLDLCKQLNVKVSSRPMGIGIISKLFRK